MDEEELANFTRLAASWWDETGEFVALHAMNKLRIPFIRDALVHMRENGPHNMSLPLEGRKIVDAGSGGGLLAEVCSGLDFCLDQDVQVCARWLDIPEKFSSHSFLKADYVYTHKNEVVS